MQRIQESAAELKERSAFPLNLSWINILSSVTVTCSSLNCNHICWELAFPHRALLCLLTERAARIPVMHVFYQNDVEFYYWLD